MLPSHNIRLNYPFAFLPHLVHLNCEAFDEVIEPTGQANPLLAHALDGRIESCTVAVIVFTDREQPFEVVTRPVERKRGQQARGAPIAIYKWAECGLSETAQCRSPESDGSLVGALSHATSSAISGETSSGGGGV